MSRSVREEEGREYNWGSSGTRTGGKQPFVCQSDDQFTVFNYAIKKGMRVSLSQEVYPPIIAITVPELGIHRQRPFDHDLHVVAKSLRPQQKIKQKSKGRRRG